MSNKEKDIRLPEGFSSWFALAEKTMNQDQYNFEAMNAPAQAPVFLNNDSRVYQKTRSQETGAVIEYFESDVLTIKIRAFDELNEIIPDLEGLIEMRTFMSRHLYFLDASANLEDMPLIAMIDKLISLKT